MITFTRTFLLVLGKTKNSKVNLFFILTLILSAPQAAWACPSDSEEGWKEELQLLCRARTLRINIFYSAVSKTQKTGGQSHQSWDALIFILLCTVWKIFCLQYNKRERSSKLVWVVMDVSCLHMCLAFLGTEGGTIIMLACFVPIWSWTGFGDN